MKREYERACATLREALRFGMDLSLEPIERMCAAMGDPQKSYACLQVAGTNGKTSTARMTAALVQACAGTRGCAGGEGDVAARVPSAGTRAATDAPAKIGLYTSPGLTCYNERMEIFEGGAGHARAISDGAFAEAIDAAVAAGEKAGVVPTEFELLTAAALWWFAEEGVDAAVLECGLGGRWDATSVVEPAVSVLTGVGLDHTRILGDTLEQIAGEKAAIIKPGSTAVLAPGLPCRAHLVRRAREVGASVVDADPADLDLLADPRAISSFPSYQRPNIATALKAAEAFFGERIAACPQASRVLSALFVPGRFECLRKDPLLIIDAAHNPQSAAVLAKEAAARFEPPMPALLLGILADKDAAGIVHALAPLFSDIVVTRSSSPRALDPHDLAALVAAETGHAPACAPDIESALSMLAGTPLLATGSITVAGEVKRLVRA